MLVYFILLIVTFVAGIFINKNKSKYGLLSFIAIAVVSLTIGLRYKTGIDWVHFKQCYERVVLGLNVDIEIGFKLLSLLFGKYLMLDSWTIFTIMALLCICPLYAVEKKYYKNLYILVPLYLLLNLTSSLTVSRQYAAMGMMVWAIKYLLIEKDNIRYVTLGVLAALLHSTAFLFIPIFWFIANSKIVQLRCMHVYIILFFVMTFVSQYSTEIFAYIYDKFSILGLYIGKESYTDNIHVWADQVGNEEDEVSKIGSFLTSISTLMLIYYGDKLLKDSGNLFLYFMYHVSVIGNIIYPTFQSQELLKRIVWYFTIFTPFIYAPILDKYVFNKSFLAKVSLGRYLMLIWLVYIFYSYLNQGAAINFRFS